MHSLPARWVALFHSPGEVFDELREEPRWFGALAAGAVLVTASVASIPADVWAEMMRAQLVAQGGGAEVDPAFIGRIARISAIVGGLIGWFVFALIAAGLSSIVFAFVLGDNVRWKQMLAGVAHAWLIPATGALLLAPLRIQQRNPELSLGVGTFLPGVEGWGGRFLQGLDFFSLWGWILVGIAVSRFDTRRSVGSAASILVGLAVAFAALLALIPR